MTDLGEEVAISQARAQLPALVEAAFAEGRTFVITKAGLQAAVLVPLDVARRGMQGMQASESLDELTVLAALAAAARRSGDTAWHTTGALASLTARRGLVSFTALLVLADQVGVAGDIGWRAVFDGRRYTLYLLGKMT